MKFSSATSVVLAVLIVLGGIAPLARSAFAADGSSEPKVQAPYLESWKVAARSLVLPGWGQFHLGESGRGQAYLAGALVGAVLAFEVVRFADRDNSREATRGIGWGLYGVSAIFSASSAWQSSERRNRENGWELGATVAPDGSAAVALGRSF
jgi:hypothetical protein